MAASDIKAGRAFVEVAAEDKASGTLSRIGGQFKQFGAAVQQLGMKLANLAGGVRQTLKDMVAEFAEFGDTVHKVGQRAGVSAEFVSGLMFAASQSGQDISVVEKSFEKMVNTMEKLERGGARVSVGFKKLGLTYEDLKDLAPEEQFKLIADRISQLPTHTERAIAAQVAFGKAGNKLLPMFADGAAGLDAFVEKAEKFGLIIDQDTADRAAALTDSMDLFSRAIKAVRIQIGAALEGRFTSFNEQLAGVVATVTQWIKENKELVNTIFVVVRNTMLAGFAIAALGAAIVAAGAVIASLSSITAALSTALGVVASVLGFLASPMGVALAAAIALGVGFFFMTEQGKAATDTLTEGFGALGTFASGVFTSIGDALKRGDLALAAEIAMAAVKLKFLEATEDIKQFWVDLKQGIVDIMIDLALQVATLVAKTIRQTIKQFRDFVSSDSTLGKFLGQFGKAGKVARAALSASALGLDIGTRQNLPTEDSLRAIADAVRTANNVGSDAERQQIEQSIADAAQALKELQKQAKGEQQQEQGERSEQFAEAGAAASTAAGGQAFSAAGTFSAAAATLLGRGGPARDLLDESKKQTKLLEELNANVVDIGGEFT